VRSGSRPALSTVDNNCNIIRTEVGLCESELVGEFWDEISVCVCACACLCTHVKPWFHVKIKLF